MPPSTVLAADGEFTDQDSGLKFRVLTEDADAGTGTVEVAQDNYAGAEYSVPETVQNGGLTYTVTGIGEKAFYQCSNLVSPWITGTVLSVWFLITGQ
jgi:hypothetical protein